MTIIPIDRVTEKTTLGRSTIYNYMRDGKFPASVRMGERHVVWVEAEVDAWVRERVTESRAANAEEVAA